MKNITKLFCVGLILNFLVSIFNSAHAQQPWNYSSIEELCMDNAYLVMPPNELLPKVERKAIGKVRYNSLYHVSGPYRQHRFLGRTREYIRFQNAAADFRLTKEAATLLLPYLVSDRYWRQRFDAIRRWDFVNASLASAYVGTDSTSSGYCNISWLAYHFKPSVDWPVYFTVAVCGGEPQCLQLDAMERLAQQGAYATYADWHRYNDADNQVWLRHNQMYAELQRHFDSLSYVSSQLDRHADSMLTALQNDSLAAAEQQSRDAVERLKARMIRDEIFFMSINPARSDYMFGLEFNLFNCFPKTITKIEITVTPYNDRTKVQEDKFGRSTRTVRCMGPIYPGSPAQYSFDELYWNDRGGIKFMRVTGIVFHFTDGTTKSYSGYDRIMKHCLN